MAVSANGRHNRVQILKPMQLGRHGSFEVSEFTQGYCVLWKILKLAISLGTKSLISCVSLDYEAFKQVHTFNTGKQVADERSPRLN